MKKALGLILVLFACLTTKLKAQDYNTSIGLSISPGLASVYARGIQTHRHFKFSKSYDISFRKRLFSHYIYLESGFQLLDRGLKAEIDWFDEIGQFWKRGMYKETSYFATVPLSLLFKYKGLYTGVGGNLGYLVFQRLTLDGDIIDLRAPRVSTGPQLGALLTFGYETEVIESWLVSLDTWIAPGVTRKYFNAGISIGFNYIR